MKIRGVQLDLARQKEEVCFIIEFINFLEKYCFNTLILYLEGKIKTKTFPFLSDEEAYLPEEIREIVNHAQRKNIQVIPVVSTLGHTEIFLQCQELRKIAELYPDFGGRWFKKGYFNMTCPSKKETYEFFENYFSEIVPLFKSQFFHAGLDESWEIGRCEECKKRIEKLGKPDFIFSDHIKRIYKILKKFGKRMMMWDDMFEIYPEALEDIPRDIIMCCWNYSYFVNKPFSHFTNHKKEDVFRKYENKGFDYLFCTGDTPTNIYSFTRYALRYRVLGGFVTNWERALRFQFDIFPVIVFASRLWNKRDIENFDIDKELGESIKKLTGIREKNKINILKAYYLIPFSKKGVRSNFIRGEISPEEEKNFRTLEILLNEIYLIENKNEIVKEMERNLKEDYILWNLRKLLYKMVEGEKRENEIKNILSQISSLKEEKIKIWKKYRRGILYDHVEKYYEGIKQQINKFLSLTEKTNYFLYLSLFLPDIYGAPFISSYVIGKNNYEMKIFENENLKPSEESPYYEIVFPFSFKEEPEMIRIEYKGFGGQGLRFLRIKDKNGNEFVPEKIVKKSGFVFGEENVLLDDLRSCYLGTREIKKCFEDERFASKISYIEIRLIKKMQKEGSQ